MKNKTREFKIFILATFLAVILSGFIPLKFVAADESCADLKAQIDALDKAGTLGNEGEAVQPVKGLPEYCTVNALSYKVITIFFYVAGGIAVVFIMIGGFQYIVGMSTGGDEAIGKAKKTITYALVGLVIIVLAGTIVIMVYNLLMGNTTGGAGGQGNRFNDSQTAGPSDTTIDSPSNSDGGTGE